MTRNNLLFGMLSGLVITSWMVYSASACYTNPEFESNNVLGYAGMIAAFSFIFVGIKIQRDKHNEGAITFGKAFKTGFLIALIAATMYTAVWLIDYYVFIPEFIDKYTQHVLYEARLKGLPDSELDLKAKEMADFKEMYKNPLFIIVVTYLEVLPVGAIVALISALILKKKSKVSD